jgi:type I restriction enzyme M protein
VVLMNPPFPHKKTDTPPEAFIARVLEGLRPRGRLAVLVPTSLLVKSDKSKWRNNLKSKNTIDGIISFERELWHPYADSVTSILLMTKGIPHPANKEVFFAKVKNDGFRVIKQVRTPVSGSQVPYIEPAYHKHETIPGLCGWAKLGQNWGPGLYVPAVKLGSEEVISEVYYLTRSRSAAMVAYAPRIFEMQTAIDANRIAVRLIRDVKRRMPKSEAAEGKIGHYFDVIYGQKELHSKRDLAPGAALVISAQGTNNGWYDFFDLATLLAPPFVTVPSTGSIGQANVQEWPCGVTDDCLILVPKEGVRRELLYVAAAVVRSERWRFNYGMKATPDRIRDYPLPADPELLDRIGPLIEAAERIEQMAFEAAENEEDARTARKVSIR